MQATDSDSSAFTPATTAKEKSDFLRQSAWMIFATFAAGALMWLVHFLNKFLPKEEYGTLGTLMTSMMLVPTIPLQMVFARQTAAAFAKGRQQELAGMVRCEIANPAALWVTLAVILASLWTPLFAGLLQGCQQFKGLGWIIILQAVGRIGSASF